MLQDHCDCCCFRCRSVQCQGIVDIVRGWRKQDKPTENVTVKYLTKHMAYVFYKLHICFYLPVLKKTNTLHICMAA